MHISLPLITILLPFTSAQTYPECTMEAARSDDCAAVINANACYNKFRWNAQTLTCIDGTDNAVKAKKVCCQSKRILWENFGIGDYGLSEANNGGDRCASVVVA
jgi:hypothetical protein